MIYSWSILCSEIELSFLFQSSQMALGKDAPVHAGSYYNSRYSDLVIPTLEFGINYIMKKLPIIIDYSVQIIYDYWWYTLSIIARYFDLEHTVSLRAVTNVRTSLENTAMIFTKLEFQVFGDRTDPLPPSIPLPKVENPRY